MRRNGITSEKDFDVVRVLKSSRRDSKKYWTVKKVGNTRVLYVPPIRPEKIYKTALDQDVNTTRNGEMTLLMAYANRKEIDWSTTNLPSNLMKVYAADAPSGTVLKKAFRKDVNLFGNEMTAILDALGTNELGTDWQLLGWMYIDYANAIEPINRRNRTPRWVSENLMYYAEERQFLGLPNAYAFDPHKDEKFDLLIYLTRLNKDL